MLLGSKIALRQVVRSINGVADQVTLVGRGGAIITQDGNRIIITAGSGSGSSAWELSGNAGLDTSNFIGTLDTASFKIKVNNSLACQIINSPDPEFAMPLPIILGGTKNHVVNAAQSGGYFIGSGGSKFSGRSKARGLQLWLVERTARVAWHLLAAEMAIMHRVTMVLL